MNCVGTNRKEWLRSSASEWLWVRWVWVSVSEWAWQGRGHDLGHGTSRRHRCALRPTTTTLLTLHTLHNTAPCCVDVELRAVWTTRYACATSLQASSNSTLSTIFIIHIHTNFLYFHPDNRWSAVLSQAPLFFIKSPNIFQTVHTGCFSRGWHNSGT